MSLPTSGTKIATIQVATGSDDERDLETFVQDVKSALAEAEVVKRATYLTGYYLVNGEPIRADGRNAITGDIDKAREDRAEESEPKAAKKATAKKATAKKATAKKAEPEPSAEDRVRTVAKKVAASALSMKKG